MPKMLTEDGLKNRIGPRFRALREKNGLTRAELMAQLQLLGIDNEKGFIKRIEYGKRYVNELELRVIAKYFGVTYDYLIDGIESVDNKDCPSP